MPKTWEICGGDNTNPTLAGATTLWAVPDAARADTEPRVEHTVYDTYTLKNLLLRVISNATTAASTATSRKNQAPGAQSVSIGDGLTGLFEDTTNSDSLVSGDEFCLQMVAGAGGTIDFTNAGFLLQHATDDVPILGAAQAVNFAASTTRFSSIGGGIRQFATETTAQYTFRSTSTLKNLRAFISGNGATADSTFAVNVNTVTSALSITIGAGLTGAFEDTTNTAAIVAGDEANYIFINGAGGGVNQRAWQVQCNSIARPVLCAGSNVAFSADRYLTPEGDINTSITTESDSQHKARVAFNAKNLFVNVPAHGLSGGVNVYLRQNTANSVLTVTIGESLTGFFEDTTNSVAVADQDLFNYLVDHGGGGGTCTISCVGFGLEQGDAPGRRTGALLGVGT